MKPETLVKKILEAIEKGKPTSITYNGKKINISKSTIEKFKNYKIREDLDFNEIDKQAKEGGFLPLLPLIFGGLAAAGAVAGGASGIASAVNKKKAEDAAAKERQRHNLEMEKLAKGSGIPELLGTIKDFGKKFSQETKKTVKQGLSNLIDKIDTDDVKMKYKGKGILFKDITSGEGLFLSKYQKKGDGVVLHTPIR